MSSSLDTKEKKVVKSKPVSAVVNGSVAVPGSYVDEYAVRLPVCTSTDIKNGSGVSAVSGIVPHLDLALNSGHSSKESSSGFMLISVGHLSKVRRDKCRNKSASSLDSKTNARSYGVIDHNSVESSSREGSSPSYSQSPVGDDFYGSGHIEAEEFEEDTEDYVTNEDDGTVTHNATVKLLAKRCPRDASRMGSCVQCAPISANSEALQTLYGGRISKYLANQSRTNSSALNLRPLRAELHNHSASSRVPRLRHSVFPLHSNDHPPLCENPRRLSRLGVYGGYSQEALYPSLATTHRILSSALHPYAQTNTSHPETQLSIFNPFNHSIHTAPVSGQVSPLHSFHMPVETVATSMPGSSPNGNSVPRPSRLLGHHEQVSGTTQSPMIYTCYNHTPHSTYGPTCPLHQHSGGASNSHSTNLINATDGNHLTASGAVLSVATVPSLQPASRFRKARIHETVEQWSCGRASIHDCRLKTVPGWVSELQKKSCLLERDVTTAMAQKVNCLSCLEMRTHDQNQAGCQHLLNLPSVVNAYNLNEPPSGHPHHSQSKADPSNVKTTSINGKPLTNNLFLFWDDGCRVNRQLPKLSHCKGVHDYSIADLTSQEVDLCPLCACSMVNTTEPPGDLCQTKLVNHSHNLETVRQTDRVTLGPRCELQSRKENTQLTVLTTDGTLMENASSTVQPNAADPATAYLRRYQIDSVDPTAASLSVPAEPQTKCGDSPSVDELSTTTLSTPDSADFPNHLPPSYSTLSKHNSNDVNRISGLHLHGGHARTKKVVKVLASGAVPPTSPNLFEGVQASRLTESSSTGLPGDANVFSEEAHSLRNTLDIYPEEEEEDENISRTQRRFASGSYHNVNQVGHPDLNESDAFTKTLSSAPSPSVSFQSALTDPQTTATNDRLSTGDSVKNGPISGYYCSPTRLLPMKLGREHGGKAISQSKQTRLSPASIDSNLPKEHIQNRKRFADFSGSLETRITGSMNVIRTAIERAFRDELATAHSENVMLLTEIERLTAEVTVLRGYQSAFFALRSFVAPELWERFCTEFFQSSAPPLGTHPVESISVLQTSQPDSPQHPDR